MGTPSFYIQDVLRHISEDFTHKVNISDIAKKFAVSRSKLDRDFKYFTGMTVHKYLDICRVNHAKSLLHRSTDMSLGEISAACGFESESCFFHFFRRVTGISPSEYKKNKMMNTAEAE